jgi:redox-sensitive bicupin YhaK (pirin superfamily)
MEKILHKASDRSIQDHGWLKAAHSFSFANYHDPSKVHFGLLRVLNDDIVAPGMGFGTHGHDNMEIVTIPLQGSLAHKDSLGSEGHITAGEIQIMSAGKGIQHSEFNASSSAEVNLLQIWIFPMERNIEPRYDQKIYDIESSRNSFITVVSPEETNSSVLINQNAFISLGSFDADEKATYRINYSGNGAYIFVIEGRVEIDGTDLNRRDALGVYQTDQVKLKFSEKSRLLIIEVPME